MAVKTVFVLGGPTGPTGTFEGVNILSAFTGATGQFAQWLQATGASGPVGTLQKVYNIGPTGISGAHKNVIISGFVPAGGGGTGAAWDPAQTVGPITLSQSNQIATTNVQGATGCITRSLTAKNTGKWYAEIAMTDPTPSSSVFMGVQNGTKTRNSLSTDSGMMDAIEGTGTMVNDTNVIGSLGGNFNAQTLRVAIDFDANLGWLARGSGNWNANASADPATGIGGVDISTWKGANNYLFSRMVTGATVAASHTATLTRLPSAFGVPAGFSIWT